MTRLQGRRTIRASLDSYKSPKLPLDQYSDFFAPFLHDPFQVLGSVLEVSEACFWVVCGEKGWRRELL